MFDAFRAPDASEKFRSAAVVPLAAFMVTQAYYTLYTLLPRVPAALFWFVAFVAFAGAAGGIFRIARVLRRHHRELDARAITWLVAAIVTTLLCAWLAISLTLPWLL